MKKSILLCLFVVFGILTANANPASLLPSKLPAKSTNILQVTGINVTINNNTGQPIWIQFSDYTTSYNFVVNPGTFSGSIPVNPTNTGIITFGFNYNASPLAKGTYYDSQGNTGNEIVLEHILNVDFTQPYTLTLNSN
ncbi:hypothetical protein [Pedobacter nutrimenti]|uniref:hypothetical protein n=1 Tax=Pedobacter nutrimenti TaxID=1241337 RepID=UPI00292E9558|nr:hypothetical protein [Pedobacter nutrimenti]